MDAGIPTRLIRVAGRLALTLLVLLLTLFGADRAAAQTSSEYDLKAVFLFNFAQFVEWPRSAFASPDAPFVIGILGDDPFGATLDTIVHGETVHGRPFSVRRYGTLEDLHAAPCHVLFVSKSEGARAGAVLSALKDHAILTVGESSQFTASGGVVQFLIINNKVRVRINMGVARDKHLSISSKLLRVAEVVDEPRSRG